MPRLIAPAPPSGTIVRREYLSINVLDYDADRTGATDSSAEVAAALDALVDRLTITEAIQTSNLGSGTHNWQGGELYFPQGVYDLTHLDLSGLSGIQLRGDGAGTVIKITNTDGSHGIRALNTLDAASTENWLSIQNLMVIGNALSGDNIHFENIDYLIVRNVWTQQAGRDGFHYYTDGSYGVENKVISGLFANWNGRDGAHIEGTHDLLVSDSHMEENTRHGVYGATVTNFHMSNCNIEDNVDTHGAYITDQRQMQWSNVIVEGNTYIEMTTGSSQIAMVANCALGTLTFVGGTTGSLHSSNSRYTLAASTFSQLILRGGQTVLAAGTNSIATLLDIDGYATLPASATTTFQAVAANVTFGVAGTLLGNNASAVLAFNTNGQTNTSLDYSPKNARSVKMTSTGITFVNVRGGVHVTGDITISGGAATSVTVVNGVALRNYVITIAADRTGVGFIGSGCAGSGTSKLIDLATTMVRDSQCTLPTS